MTAREALYAALCARGTEHFTAADLINAHVAEVLNEAAAEMDAHCEQYGVFGVGDRLLRMAREKSSPAGADATPGFFQAGHTYARENHGDTIRFLVDHVSNAPDGSYRVAFGWRLDDDGDWEPSDADDMDGWTDITGSGDR